MPSTESVDTPWLNDQYSPSHYAGYDPAEVIHNFVTRSINIREELLKSDIPHTDDIQYNETGNLTAIDIWGEVKEKLLIFYHGGYWVEGDRKGSLSMVGPLIKDGWAVASVGYDYASGGHTLKATVRNAVQATEFLLESFHGVTTIAIGGHSAGAHLAFRVCSILRSPRLNALILFAGVLDLKELVTCQYGRDIGLTAEAAHEESCSYSQLLDLHMSVLILVGTKDSPKLIEQSSKIFEQLRHANEQGKSLLHDVCFEILHGVDHFDLVINLHDESSHQTITLLSFLKRVESYQNPEVETSLL